MEFQKIQFQNNYGLQYDQTNQIQSLLENKQFIKSLEIIQSKSINYQDLEGLSQKQQTLQLLKYENDKYLLFLIEKGNKTIIRNFNSQFEEYDIYQKVHESGISMADLLQQYGTIEIKLGSLQAKLRLKENQLHQEKFWCFRPQMFAPLGIPEYLNVIELGWKYQL